MEPGGLRTPIAHHAILIDDSRLGKRLVNRFPVLAGSLHAGEALSSARELEQRWRVTRMNDSETPTTPTNVPAPEPERVCLLTITTPIKHFSEIFGIMGAIADEGVWNVTETGIRFSVVDPAHVTLIDASIPKELLAEFRPNRGSAGTVSERIGIPVMDLNQWLKNVSALDKKAGASLRFYSQGSRSWVEAEANGGKSVIQCPDPLSISDPKVPKLDLPASLETLVKPLHATLREANRISDHIRLSSESAESVTISAKSSDGTQTYTQTLSALHGGRFDVGSGKLVSKFSLDYLKACVASVKGSPTVELTFGTDYPIILKWNGFSGTFRYLMAPRIESD